ncbi:hypothetical protein EV426DRAFT_186105 [Tirmania nivea]|nr:hypothetical protein EV426DRAFT_186105 [Tirmania nivea]
MSASMTAYDRDVLRKLSPIPPRSNQRMPYSPIDDGPASAESEPGRRSGWNFTPTSSPIAIGSRSSESPMERWPIGNSRRELRLARMALSPEQHPPVFQSSMDYRNSGSDSLSVSSLGPNDDSYGDSVRSPITGFLVGSSSFDSSRGRLPLRPRKSYDRMGRMDDDLMMEDISFSHISKLRHLNLGSETPPRPNSYPVLNGNSNNHQRAGSKRRASSPPHEDRIMAQTELTRKSTYDGTEAPQRRSPIGPQLSAARYSPCMGSKFHPSLGMHPPSTGSSFASSAGTGWSNSLGASSIVSAATSYSPQDRSSPGASFSPQSDPETSSDSPYMSNTNSRRGNRQRTSQDLQATPLSDREAMPPKLSPVPKLHGVHICECCPKKPKKFETKEELHIHEMEKQYTCNFCRNRFKNKNEAERHQNSLHLRKHSWSCAALSGAEAAFHPSSQRPGAFDVCGYCGKEFPAPANWELRREHLTAEHKFGECNQAKKFFRADHFRQHLKHSHSGTTGKWTNVLENACMRDESGADGSVGIIGHGNSVISEE